MIHMDYYKKVFPIRYDRYGYVMLSTSEKVFPWGMVYRGSMVYEHFSKSFFFMQGITDGV
jgi:hypothetical protein